MKIQHIMVPVDFSPPSHLAVDCGLSWARHFGAKLTLLHVVEILNDLEIPLTKDSAELYLKRYAQAERMLPSLVSAADRTGVDFQTLTDSGLVDHKIAAAVAEQRPDLVIMGTHGRGLFGRLLIGSVTHRMLRETHVPIVTVIGHGAGAHPPQRILFATDLGRTSKAAFASTLEFAFAAQARVLAFHVIVMPTTMGAEAQIPAYASEELREEARTRLREMEEMGKRRQVQVETAMTEGNAAATEILACAASKSADLIVIGVSKKGILDKAIMGATAERLIRESPIPVLSLPPQE